MLGLPDETRACLFDLDGVLTKTAEVHAAAWKEMFDAYLRERSERMSEPFVPFATASDYPRYVDGLPRADGVRNFLASRGIELPEGHPDDPPEAETVQGLGRRKNDLVLRLIHERGVEAYGGSVEYLHAARDAGLHRAVVTSSKNCAEVVEAAGIADLLELSVDGHIAERDGLRGKPAPDTFLAAAAGFGLGPNRAAVFEDALAGVEAGRAGGFAAVIGVDRTGHGDALATHGATRVVSDLTELLERP